MEEEQAIRKAEELFESGKSDEAKRMLDELLLQNSVKDSVYYSVIERYVYEGMYQEAKKALECYKAKTGRDIGEANEIFSEVEKLEKIDQQYSQENMKIFKRVSLRQGSISFCPIKEVRICENKLVLKISSKEREYKWSEIDAAIVRQETDRMTKNIYYFKTPEKIYHFNITSLYADFKNSTLLIREIKKHLKIHKGGAIPFCRKNDILFLVLFLGGLIFVGLIMPQPRTIDVLWLAAYLICVSGIWFAEACLFKKRFIKKVFSS